MVNFSLDPEREAAPETEQIRIGGVYIFKGLMGTTPYNNPKK